MTMPCTYHLFFVDISLDSFSLDIRIVGELALVPLLAETLLEELAEHRLGVHTRFHLHQKV
jgi:hypothetical protein